MTRNWNESRKIIARNDGRAGEMIGASAVEIVRVTCQNKPWHESEISHESKRAKSVFICLCVFSAALEQCLVLLLYQN